MRFLVSTRIFSTLIIILLISACDSKDDRKAAYLEKANTYYIQGNFDKARVEVKNVLQIDPKFTEGYYLMGLIEEQRQNLRMSFSYLSKAIELDPTHIKANAKLGRFYAISGNTKKASELLTTIFSINPKSMDGMLLNLIIYSKTNKAKAIELARSIIKQDPTQIDAIRMLAILYIKTKKNKKAIDTLKKGILKMPKNILLKQQLAEAYAIIKDFKSTELVLKYIIKLKPDDFSSHIKLASFYVQRSQFNKAENEFKNIILLNPGDDKGYLLLAEFQSRSRSVETAEVTLINAITDYPDLYRLRFALAKLYKATKSKNEKTVYQNIIRLANLKPEGIKARNKLAKLVLSYKDVSAAKSLINEILANNPGDNDALLLKGKIAIVEKDLNTATDALRSIVKNQPGLVEAVSLLATAHIHNNERELAVNVFKQGINNSPKNPKMYLNYANYLQKTGDFISSEKITNDALKVSPKNISALKLKVKFALNRHNRKEVYTAINNIIRLHPKKSVGYQLLGDYLSSLQKYSEALIEYQLALKYSKRLLPHLASIIKLNIIQNDFDKAISRLNKIIKEKPTNAIIYTLLGEVYSAQKKYALAKITINKAIDLDDKSIFSYASLAGVYLAQQDMESSIKVYQQALKKLPNNIQILSNLAKIYEKQDMHDKAIYYYEKILTINPRNTIATSNLAILLADRKSDTASLVRAKELAMRFENSENPAFLDIIGWIYYKSGEFDKSLPILNRVVKKTQTVPIFQYHLGMAYYQTGDKKAAKIYLSKALESGKKFQGRLRAEQLIKRL